MPIAVPFFAVSAGLGAVLVGLLMLGVIRQRIRHRLPFGDIGRDGVEVKPLRRAIRAHGNCVETLPAMLAVILAAELTGAPPVALWTLATLALGGRVLHAIALTGGGPVVFRQIGVLATLGVLVVGGLAVAVHALV